MFRRTTICPSGWLYLILLTFIISGALMREINLLMFVAGLMAGPLALSWWLTSWMTSRVDVRRIVPRGIGVGETFTVQLKTTNNKKRLPSWALILGDRISRVRPAGDRPVPVSAYVPFLASGQTDQTSYEGKLLRRGQYRFGPIVLASRFPLGLFRRIQRLDEMTTIFAYPQLGRLTRDWVEMLESSRIGNQRAQNRIGFLEGEFHSLRDWRTGDSRRWIHWRTSARRNELTVKQFEHRQNRDLAIFVDLHESTDVTDQLEYVVEKAVRFAATIVAHTCRRGNSRMLLGVAGRTVDVVSGMSSSGLMEESMEKLAVAEGTPENQLEALIRQSRTDLANHSTIILLGTDPQCGERFEHAWAAAGSHQRSPRVVKIDCSSRDISNYFEDFDTVSRVQEALA